MKGYELYQDREGLLYFVFRKMKTIEGTEILTYLKIRGHKATQLGECTRTALDNIIKENGLVTLKKNETRRFNYYVSNFNPDDPRCAVMMLNLLCQ